jgi:hypothetical protein
MPSSPPTSPGPLPPKHSKRPHPVLVGAIVHGCVAILACAIVPFAAGSNLFPISAVVWSIFTAPPAAGFGALVGWIVHKHGMRTIASVMTFTAIVVASISTALILRFW